MTMLSLYTMRPYMMTPTFLKLGIFLVSHLLTGYVVAMPTIYTLPVARDDDTDRNERLSRIRVRCSS